MPEAHDPAYAFGSGEVTVHEVATHPTAWDQAYLSYDAARIRSVEIGVTTRTRAPVSSAFVCDGRTIVLGSDRDSGLRMFEDTTP